MRVIALLSLLIGSLGLLILDGQTFTHAVMGIVCGIVAGLAGWASARHPNQREGPILAALGLGLALFCVIQLPSAYRHQTEFNEQSRKAREMRQQSESRQQLTEPSAIQIANRYAEHLGYHLADYYEPKVEGPADYYPPSFPEQALGVYWIRYEPKVPMLKTNMYGAWATNCLDIFIDAKTGAAKKAVVRAREEIVD